MASSQHDAKILTEMEKQTYHLSQISWFLNSILGEYQRANRAKAEARDKGDRKAQGTPKKPEGLGKKIARRDSGGMIYYDGEDTDNEDSGDDIDPVHAYLAQRGKKVDPVHAYLAQGGKNGN